ncbi:MAG: hypothetical protein ACTSQ5_10420 [Promethearchaeota archaeon]
MNDINSEKKRIAKLLGMNESFIIMDLDLNKKSVTLFKIKNEDFEALSISTIEENKKLKEILFKQYEFSLNYSQFSLYFNYLSQVKSNIDLKYILPDYKYKKSKERKIAPLSLKGSLKIPEVYFITNNGLCLFHFLAVRGKMERSPINQNLVSGLLSAINSFAENIGWTSGVQLIKAGEIEVRFSKKEHIFVALMTNVNSRLSHLVEPTLFDFASDIGEAFEKNYSKQIFACYDKGIVDSDDYTKFQDTINKFFIRYRKQTFDLYQKLILTEAIYLGAPHDYCVELIHLVSEGKSVISELAKLMKEYPVISTAIQKVNFDQKPVWDIFGVPIYDFTKE